MCVRRRLIRIKVYSRFGYSEFFAKFSVQFKLSCFEPPMAVKSQTPEKAPAGGSSINQLLGIKGASQETVILKNKFFNGSEFELAFVTDDIEM